MHARWRNGRDHASFPASILTKMQARGLSPWAVVAPATENCLVTHLVPLPLQVRAVTVSSFELATTLSSTLRSSSKIQLE